jgi:hypothetical protein
MFFDEQVLWGGLTMVNYKFYGELLSADCVEKVDPAWPAIH